MAKNENTCCKKTSIGGQALMEGIMMRGPYKTAIAMRRANGEIQVEEKDPPKQKFINKIPILRGPFVFVRSMKIGTSALMRSAEVTMEDEFEKLDSQEEQEEVDTSKMTPRQLRKYEKERAKKEKQAEKDRKQKEKINAKIAELNKKYQSDKNALNGKFNAQKAAIEAALQKKTAGKSEQKVQKLTEKANAEIASKREVLNKKLRKLRKEHNEEVAAWKRGEGGALNGLVVTLSTLLGFGLAIVLFFFLPTWCYTGLLKILPERAVEYLSANTVWQSVFEGVLKLIIFVLYVKLATLMDETKRLFMYHGAEHKSIFCYEAGEELTVENVRKFKRFHPRCGTSFLIIMMVIGIVVGIFIPRTIPYAAFLRPVIKLLLIPLTMGVGYELLKLCGRYDNIITKIVAAPGLLMQRLTTAEPDDGQIECAIEALKAVIPEDGSDQW